MHSGCLHEILSLFEPVTENHTRFPFSTTRTDLVQP